MDTSLEGLPYDDAILRELGRATVEFSSLDHILSFGIAFLLFGGTGEDQERGELITGRMTFSQKIDLFSRVSIGTGRCDPGAVKTLCRQLDAVREERNDLQHSLWLPTQVPAFRTVSLSVSRRGVSRRTSDIADKTVRAHVERIEAARNEFLRFLDENFVACGRTGEL